MQPYFFPYLGYFQHINSVDKYILLDDVNFIKKGWIHRNNILMNGSSKQINLAIQKASQNSLIKELILSDDIKWKSKLIMSLRHSYSKAPQYKEVMPLLDSIINNSESNLSLYLSSSLVSTCEYLGISTLIEPTSSRYEKGDLKGEDRIISICMAENCSEYINPSGGVDLYNREKFKQKDVKLSFIKLNNVKYEQAVSPFVPNLSIIDVMMNNTKEEIQQLLTNYTLFENE